MCVSQEASYRLAVPRHPREGLVPGTRSDQEKQRALSLPSCEDVSTCSFLQPLLMEVPQARAWHSSQGRTIFQLQ